MRVSQTVLNVLLIAKVIFPLACKAPVNKIEPVTREAFLSHDGKNLRLVRRATPAEFETASRRLPFKSGDEIWYYETMLEILADETGFCLIREGQIIGRYFISAS